MVDRIHLEVVTPTELVLSVDVDEVVAPGELGEFGVLPGHRPIISIMSPGELKYTAGSQESKLIVWGGIVEAKDNECKVITVNAERPEDIDKEVAQRELQAIVEQVRGFTGGGEELKDLHNKLKLAEARASAGD